MLSRFAPMAMIAGLLISSSSQAQQAPAPPPAEEPPKYAVVSSKWATDLFRDDCLAQLGNGDAILAALKEAGFIGAGNPMQEFLLEGKPGSTWMRDKPPVGAAAMIRPEGAECVVVVQHALPALHEADFRAMIAALAPGSIATEVPDASRLPDDPMRIVSFRLHTAAAGPDRVVSLRMDSSPRSFFPVKLAASMVMPPAPPPSIEVSAPLPGKQP